jgi:hypothetical protein
VSNQEAEALSLASDSETPAEVLERLAESRSRAVLEALAKNPSTPARILWRLARAFPGEVLENPVFPLLLIESPILVGDPSVDRAGLLALLRHPAAPEGLFWNVFDAREPYFHALIASNPSAPPAVLRRLLLVDQPDIRRLARENPSTPQETIQALLRAGASANLDENETQSPDPEMSADELRDLFDLGGFFAPWIALQHQNTPPDLFLRAAESNHPFIAGLALLAYEMHPQWADWQELCETLLISVVQHDAVKVMSESLSSEDLRWLARSENTQTRLRVAENPRTPPETLAEMALEAHVALYAVLAKNPSTPPETLLALARAKVMPGTTPLLDGERWYVLQSLSENPAAPAAALEEVVRQIENFGGRSKAAIEDTLLKNDQLSPELRHDLQSRVAARAPQEAKKPGTSQSARSFLRALASQGNKNQP